MAPRFPVPQRTLLAVLLAASLAAPAVLAAQPRLRAEERETGFIATLATELRAQVWGLLSRIWEKEGCVIDPHGSCNKSMTDESDAGCVIDPHGVCGTTEVVTEEGCSIDPHGGCRH